MEKMPCVYIMASKKYGTLYVGVTSDLITRVFQHKHDMVEGFTKKYSVHRLVYYEITESIITAIQREKQLKAGSRKRKIDLIEFENPDWLDLYDQITG